MKSSLFSCLTTMSMPGALNPACTCSVTLQDTQDRLHTVFIVGTPRGVYVTDGSGGCQHLFSIGQDSDRIQALTATSTSKRANSFLVIVAAAPVTDVSCSLQDCTTGLSVDMANLPHVPTAIPQQLRENMATSLGSSCTNPMEDGLLHIDSAVLQGLPNAYSAPVLEFFTVTLRTLPIGKDAKTGGYVESAFVQRHDPFSLDLFPLRLFRTGVTAFDHGVEFVCTGFPLAGEAAPSMLRPELSGTGVFDPKSAVVVDGVPLNSVVLTVTINTENDVLVPAVSIVETPDSVALAGVLKFSRLKQTCITSLDILRHPEVMLVAGCADGTILFVNHDGSHFPSPNYKCQSDSSPVEEGITPFNDHAGEHVPKARSESRTPENNPLSPLTTGTVEFAEVCTGPVVNVKLIDPHTRRATKQCASLGDGVLDAFDVFVTTLARGEGASPNLDVPLHFVALDCMGAVFTCQVTETKKSREAKTQILHNIVPILDELVPPLSDLGTVSATNKGDMGVFPANILAQANQQLILASSLEHVAASAGGRNSLSLSDKHLSFPTEKPALLSFSHQKQTSLDPYCCDFLLGACSKGNNCRYKHQDQGNGPLCFNGPQSGAGPCQYGSACYHGHQVTGLARSSISEMTPGVGDMKETPPLFAAQKKVLAPTPFLSVGPLFVLALDVDGDGVQELLITTQARQCIVCKLQPSRAQPFKSSSCLPKRNDASEFSPWAIVDVLDLPSPMSFLSVVRMRNGTRRMFGVGPVHTILSRPTCQYSSLLSERIARLGSILALFEKRRAAAPGIRGAIAMPPEEEPPPLPNTLQSQMSLGTSHPLSGIFPRGSLLGQSPSLAFAGPGPLQGTQYTVEPNLFGGGSI